MRGSRWSLLHGVRIENGRAVTVRALQLAFRKHLDATPLAMLRRLRLAAAHEQLRAAVPGGAQP
ncbi:hypothetical protein ACFWF7_14540 [Nocardia sp. NPDC060256]|uniref:hypothetical protein n=1 Tax=unclassified Nocardia TaxID=2637762 RepID=UPI00365632AE